MSVSESYSLICRQASRGNLHVTKGDHADCLPDTQSDTRSHTTVKALDTVGLIDILQCLPDGQVLRAVGVISLALHLDTDDLDRLIPSRQATAQTAGKDLFETVQLLRVVLVRDFTDSSLCQPRQSETRTPVCCLADGHGVDTTVDAADTLLPVDIHESRKGGRWFHTGGSHLVLRNFDGLHAGTETHGRVSLGNTTNHTAGDTTAEVVCTKSFGVVFSLGRNEEEDGTLCGSLNPGPGNETLVVYRGIIASAGENLQRRVWEEWTMGIQWMNE